MGEVGRFLLIMVQEVSLAKGAVASSWVPAIVQGIFFLKILCIYFRGGGEEQREREKQIPG